MCIIGNAIINEIFCIVAQHDQATVEVLELSPFSPYSLEPCSTLTHANYSIVGGAAFTMCLGFPLLITKSIVCLIAADVYAAFMIHAKGVKAL